MADDTARTALVTGANSGLGLETAAQLAERGYTTVTITARTAEKAAVARRELVDRTGKDVFETLVLDNGDLGTIEAAVQDLVDRGTVTDMLVLNAGIVPGSLLSKTADGLEATVASTLTGHHVLTTRMLEHGLLGDGARIVIAGSEAARGDVPTFKPVDMTALASEHFGGDLERAIETQIRMDAPAKYKPSDTYATAKMFVAWWAAELARHLPDGMAVNAVSPGSVPETNAVRNAPFYMRRLMVPLFKLLPGMSSSVADGASRYLEVGDYDSSITGKFFASKPKKLIGQLVEVDLAHLDHRAGQEALSTVLNRLTGVGFPAGV